MFQLAFAARNAYMVIKEYNVVVSFRASLNAVAQVLPCLSTVLGLEAAMTGKNLIKAYFIIKPIGKVRTFLVDLVAIAMADILDIFLQDL